MLSHLDLSPFMGIKERKRQGLDLRAWSHGFGVDTFLPHRGKLQEARKKGRAYNTRRTCDKRVHEVEMSRWDKTLVVEWIY